MTRPATDAERIAIVGSRAHPNLEIVRAYVRSLPPGTVVVSGGAKGVDGAAADEAKLCGLVVVEFTAERDDYGTWGVYRTRYEEGEWSTVCLVDGIESIRDALLLRNTYIAVANRSIVFPDGSKGGCWDAAREAVRFKRPVEVRWCNGEVQPFSKSMQRRIETQVER